jgi:hypothetical protein
MRPLRVLTWHIHGNYLWYLAQTRVEWLLPTGRRGREGYGGRGTSFPFGPNVADIPADGVKDLKLDAILFQTRTNWEEDQFEILSPAQRRLPRLYLQHDPPLEHPTNQRHWVDDPNVLLVHVTPFNALMWDSGALQTRVIEHGVIDPPGERYRGDLPRGLVVVNHMRRRGRIVGADIFQQAREDIPLDLVGMDAESLGGLGEIAPPALAAFASRYRFFFHPLRYTSLSLAAVEAMTLGLPIVGLATTELANTIRHGVSGFLETDWRRLLPPMRELLREPELARQLGVQARRVALERFSIRRFARDWENALAEAVGERVNSDAPTRSRSRGVCV